MPRFRQPMRPAISRFGDKVGGTTPFQSATIYTSDDTFVAGDAGTYRVCCIGSGGTGFVGSSPRPGGGSGWVIYSEVTLTASENVTVTIGAAVSADATNGNPTKFGSYVQGPGGEPGTSSRGGDGFSGGGYDDNADDGGEGGADGEGSSPGLGQGTSIIDFLNTKFTDVTFAAGSESSPPGGNNGAGGMNVNGSGNYGAGTTGSSSNAPTSTAGVLIVAGPY